MALESDRCNVVAAVADDATAIGACIRLEPDVCLFAGTSVGRGGFAAVRMIKSRVPGTAVVLLTDPLPSAELFAALRAGIDGLLFRSMNPDRLAPTLRQVAAGEAVLPRKLVTSLVGAFRDRQAVSEEQPPLQDRLTSREAEVVELLLNGKGTSGIAYELQLNSVTVRRHISSFVQKAGAPDRASALARLRAERRAPDARADALSA
jgi:DNA-binding NarL/FixJ family response regulator